MEKFSSVECQNCKEGVKMCHRNPCMGTVDQMQTIINAGYGSNLMLEIWHKEVRYNKNVQFLYAATEGHNAKFSPFKKGGTCIFLKDNKCSIHSIKPAEGKWSCCKIENKSVYEKWIVELIKDWDTPKGKNLIRRWRNQVKLKGKRPKPNIVDVFQLMLSSLFNG